jgi:hypothetical protein
MNRIQILLQFETFARDDEGGIRGIYVIHDWASSKRKIGFVLIRRFQEILFDNRHIADEIRMRERHYKVEQRERETSSVNNIS